MIQNGMTVANRISIAALTLQTYMDDRRTLHEEQAVDSVHLMQLVGCHVTFSKELRTPLIGDAILQQSTIIKLHAHCEVSTRASVLKE